MQVKMFSRPGTEDQDDQGHYEYNGSFECKVNPKEWDAHDREEWARVMDSFYEVLIVWDNYAITYHRTYDRP